MDGPLHMVVVLRPVVPGDEHPGAQGHAVDKAHHQQNHAAGGADRRQCGPADEVAYNEGVHRIVQLLKQVAEEDRQSKGQHLFGDAAFGQAILFVPVHWVHLRSLLMCLFIISPNV